MTLYRDTAPLFSLALAACVTSPPPLDAAASALLDAANASQGAPIYVGTVTPRGESEPAFRYERHTSSGRENWTSVHRTYAIGSDEPVVVQRAVHSERSALQRFDEVHAQTGTVSAVEVASDGSLTFERRRGGAVKRRHEGPGPPVVVGPTLFGFVLAHWDELETGRPLRVRFAATDLARSYAFDLRAGPADADTTTIRFEAASFFVRLAIARMEMVFDTRSRQILRYAGRVPPRGARLRTLDAQVEYRFVASEYR